MHKKRLVQKIAQTTGVSKDVVWMVVDEMLLHITDAVLSGDEVHLNNFGNFYLQRMSKRRAYDIYRGKEITLPPALKINFRMSRTQFKAMNNDETRTSTFLDDDNKRKV